FLFSSRRRHTRFSRDWSSDVCSSDLPHIGGGERDEKKRDVGDEQPTCPGRHGRFPLESGTRNGALSHAFSIVARSSVSAVSDAEIGRASCRERGENAVADGAVTDKTS